MTKVCIVVRQLGVDQLSEVKHEIPLTVNVPPLTLDRFVFGTFDIDQEHRAAIAEAAAHLARIRKSSEKEFVFRFDGFTGE